MALPLIVGISGATGVVYGVEMLRVLKDLGQSVHLIVSEFGLRTIGIETDFSMDDLKALADEIHSNKDVGASIATKMLAHRLPVDHSKPVEW